MSVIKILLVDGFNLIRRIFEANHRDEADISACVESCGRSLGRALLTHHPSHAVVVLESHQKTWRHLLYPAYKGDRKPTPEVLLDNLDAFIEVFQSLGVPSIKVDGYEADDVVSTLAVGVANNGGEAIILSTDKGFLSLLNDRIKVYHHFEQRFVTSADVLEKFDLGVDQLLDYWSLCGDPGNNIKGVPGVGKKTSVQLLQEFGGLEEILGKAKEMAIEDFEVEPDVPKSPWESFRKPLARVLKHEQEALACRLLVTPKIDVELGVNLKMFRRPKG